MSLTEPLFERLDEIENKIHSSHKLLLLLDFDGTLAPIVADPNRAELPPETRRVLEKLQGAGAALAFISGRALEDLRGRTGLRAIYAGNHGLEISAPGMEFRKRGAEALRPRLSDLCVRLSDDLGHIAGVWVEDKGLTASVHYRKAAPDVAREVAAIVDRALEPLRMHFLRQDGKKVFEIRPRVHWNKGSAVRWLRDRFGGAGVLPICLGDDATDEDAFRAVPDGVTVCVGSGRTHARYRVRDHSEALRFLRWLVPIMRRPEPLACVSIVQQPSERHA